MKIGDIVPIGITLVVIGILLSIGATILSDVRDKQVDTSLTACGTNSTGGSTGTILYTGCGYAYNATTNGLEGNNTLGNWIPTIAIVIASALAIGVVVNSFSRSA